MTLKEQFLAIATYEEFDHRRAEFRSLPIDAEIAEHLGELFGPLSNPPGEVFKNAPGKGLPLWEK